MAHGLLAGRQLPRCAAQVLDVFSGVGTSVLGLLERGSQAASASNTFAGYDITACCCSKARRACLFSSCANKGAELVTLNDV